MLSKAHIKGFITGITISLFMTSSVFAFTNLQQISVSFDRVKKVIIEGEELKFDETSRPLIYEGRTYIALRPLFEQYGGDVQWDPGTGTITIEEKQEEPYQEPESDAGMAKMLETALIVYIIETGDYQLKLIDPNPTVDVIIKKLKAPITDDQGYIYGPYLPDGSYVPKENGNKGWDITIGSSSSPSPVTVKPAPSDCLTFSEE